jgi:phosphoribosylglycinamide formyltransferase 2
MLDGEALDRIVAKHKPDFIVPEISHSYWTFLRLRKQGITVVPSAKAANFTMNRKAIRDLAQRIGIKTAYPMQLLQPNCDKESKPWECLA